MAGAVLPEASARFRVYLAASILQGEDLPGHVSWSGTEVAEVRVRLPPELALKEVYNVPKDSITEKPGRRVALSAFRVPGYLGLVFEAGDIKAGKRQVEVEFEIFNSEGVAIHSASRTVLLFRPLIRAGAVPARPFGLVEDRRGTAHLQPALELSNIGDGTAIVFVQLVESDGSARVAHPTRMGEFLKRYRQDLLTSMRELAKDFPTYAPLLQGYVSIIEMSKPPSPEVKREVKKLERRFMSAIEKSEDLGEALIAAIARSFFKNLEVVTEMHSFLDYLNSAGAGRVILMNGLDSLQLDSGSRLIRLRIHVTDFTFGDYPPIDLEPFILKCDKASEIPIYALFEWNSTTMAGLAND